MGGGLRINTRHVIKRLALQIPKVSLGQGGFQHHRQRQDLSQRQCRLLGTAQGAAHHLIKVVIRQCLCQSLGLGLTQSIERNIQLPLDPANRIPIRLTVPTQPEFYCLAHTSLPKPNAWQ
jgi:hypothetical protein